MKIKTKDLWQSAFCLAKGAELSEVKVDGNGKIRREVVFSFIGPEVVELEKEFQSGQAVCNVARLRAAMIHLKERMFEAINKD